MSSQLSPIILLMFYEEQFNSTNPGVQSKQPKQQQQKNNKKNNNNNEINEKFTNHWNLKSPLVAETEDVLKTLPAPPPPHPPKKKEERKEPIKNRENQ